MDAQFKVIKIDSEGSGMDYHNHLGMIVTNAKRCCKNCSCIFGKMGIYNDVLFIKNELMPLNDEAKLIIDEINEN